MKDAEPLDGRTVGCSHPAMKLLGAHELSAIAIHTNDFVRGLRDIVRGYLELGAHDVPGT